VTDASKIPKYFMKLDDIEKIRQAVIEEMEGGPESESVALEKTRT
jgi:hypothetical protein